MGILGGEGVLSCAKRHLYTWGNLDNPLHYYNQVSLSVKGEIVLISWIKNYSGTVQGPHV